MVASRGARLRRRVRRHEDYTTHVTIKPLIEPSGSTTQIRTARQNTYTHTTPQNTTTPTQRHKDTTTQRHKDTNSNTNNNINNPTHPMTRQDKTGQDRTGQGRAGQDKTRQQIPHIKHTQHIQRTGRNPPRTSGSSFLCVFPEAGPFEIEAYMPLPQSCAMLLDRLQTCQR